MSKKGVQELDFTNDFFENEVEKEQENKPSKREEMLDKLTREIFNTDNIEVRTDLNDNQISALSKGILFADHFNSKIMGQLCNNIMRLSLSKDRKSRGEFVDMAKNSINKPDELDGFGGGLSARLWGQ